MSLAKHVPNFIQRNWFRQHISHGGDFRIRCFSMGFQLMASPEETGEQKLLGWKMTLLKRQLWHSLSNRLWSMTGLAARGDKRHRAWVHTVQRKPNGEEEGWNYLLNVVFKSAFTIKQLINEQKSMQNVSNSTCLFI